ncbi:MAG TPA: hypothetical protein VE422_30440 [Terriglobia bacterium]|nr:hypothetical protein [Terriglobia bacterium]
MAEVIGDHKRAQLVTLILHNLNNIAYNGCVENGRNLMAIPERFCWTRFGTEAGQTIESILARKENERAANGGMFLWGIGNAIGPSFKELLRREANPQALFSPIKSPPKAEDVSPPAVAAWTRGETLDGKTYALPDHSLVLSRYDPAGTKRVHYTLVCYSSEPLRISESGDRIALDGLRNLLTGRPIGASQVTAVVESVMGCRHGASTYPIALRAQLVYPYFLRLLNPVLAHS